MNIEELLRDSLRGIAEEAAPAPSPGLADRALRTRTRRRIHRYAGVVAVVAAVVAIAVAGPLLEPGPEATPTGVSQADIPHVDIPQTDVIARPDQSPPRELIAAGDIAMSAYREEHSETHGKDGKVSTPIWHLYNPGAGRYEKTDWGWIDVAPGMQMAAVLERDFPVKRIGILSLATMRVVQWIPVNRGVGSVEFAEDGRRLLATAYARNPDHYGSDEEPASARTGFYVIDLASGESEYAARVSATGSGLFGVTAGRDDLSFSDADPDLVRGWGYTDEGSTFEYFDLEGNEAERPSAERFLIYPDDAGLSPDGRLVTGGMTRNSPPMSAVLFNRSGATAGEVHAQQLLAWADDKRLIAWDCDPECDAGGEYSNHLVLVGIGSNKVQTLSGFRGSNPDADGRWIPVFTSRR
ncbi:hypothetical protein SRB5_24700 [Streptomyces sp. RB5]|uniref:WD40 repeat domain-containing protein n=1 Tax=Streptomyces smaragdinus TaxID=2585196 RepID=A0A7K0CFU4_9ACTN|nr:hypothetical protein [Streptomyces smaragdinus]MQY12337.1 hypothetical protein [Streptomyces smaragdinus]